MAEITVIRPTPVLSYRLLILLVTLCILLATVSCMDDMQARSSRKGRGKIIDHTILDDIDQGFADLVRQAQEDEPDPEPVAIRLPAADYQNLSESENLSESIEEIKKEI